MDTTATEIRVIENILNLTDNEQSAIVSQLRETLIDDMTWVHQRDLLISYKNHGIIIFNSLHVFFFSVSMELIDHVALSCACYDLAERFQFLSIRSSIFRTHVMKKTVNCSERLNDSTYCWESHNVHSCIIMPTMSWSKAIRCRFIRKVAVSESVWAERKDFFQHSNKI